VDHRAGDRGLDPGVAGGARLGAFVDGSVDRGMRRVGKGSLDRSLERATLAAVAGYAAHLEVLDALGLSSQHHARRLFGDPVVGLLEERGMAAEACESSVATAPALLLHRRHELAESLAETVRAQGVRVEGGGPVPVLLGVARRALRRALGLAAEPLQSRALGRNRARAFGFRRPASGSGVAARAREAKQQEHGRADCETAPEVRVPAPQERATSSLASNRCPRLFVKTMRTRRASVARSLKVTNGLSLPAGVISNRLT